ncbi:MAG TPA: hypothetical protein VFF30_00265 [Nitrososphaerales archaeon]|nr:hypothetical protein [Nitrososphaerales archaeon]
MTTNAQTSPAEATISRPNRKSGNKLLLVAAGLEFIQSLIRKAMLYLEAIGDEPYARGLLDLVRQLSGKLDLVIGLLS